MRGKERRYTEVQSGEWQWGKTKTERQNRRMFEPTNKHTSYLFEFLIICSLFTDVCSICGQLNHGILIYFFSAYKITSKLKET